MGKKIVFGIIIILIIYLLMLWTTNDIVREVKNVMQGNISIEETRGTSLDLYNRKGDLGTIFAEAKITRLFVFHNFFDGYMWVKYSCEGFDKNGNHTYGSSNVISRWKIHREDGKWQVVEIQEKP